MLEKLLQRADLWRGRQTAPYESRPTLPSGYAALDQQLPGGGWPIGSLTEILYSRAGAGELQLTLPALERLGQTDRWIAWIDPPYTPYAPALLYCGLNVTQLFWIRTQSDKEAL